MKDVTSGVKIANDSQTVRDRWTIIRSHQEEFGVGLSIEIFIRNRAPQPYSKIDCSRRPIARKRKRGARGANGAPISNTGRAMIYISWSS